MNRSGLLVFLIIVTGVVFIARLFYLQVLDNSYDIPTLNNSAVKIKYDYPERGYVYDRNGVLLVANQLSYDIMVIPREVAPLDTLEFCNLLKISKQDFINQYRKAWNYSPRLPYIFVPQVSKADFAFLQEKMHKFKGFYIQKRSLRAYPMATAANILGYISEVNEHHIKENPYYQSGELKGAAGIEHTYEEILRGTKGKKYIQRDRFNKEIGPYKNGMYDTISKPGNDLTLTIDVTLQQYGELLMQNKRGGVIAIEPATGELLALVSSPTYDPNLMVGRERRGNYNQLDNDSINKPLFDRSLKGEYPPGSPFKIITALTALQEGVITPTSTIRCINNQYRYGNRSMACHCDTFGSPVALNKAIYRSCNSYFSNAYRKTIEKYSEAEDGMNAWSAHAKSFGLGNYLGNDLFVGDKGLVPDGNFYNRWYPNNRWTATYSISNAIGQGEVLTTPIQLANMTAAVANRGFYFTPHIVKNIKGREIDPKFTTPKYTSIDKKHFEPVIEGLFNVVEIPNGTAYWSKVEGIEICGKTGTAENPHGQDHSIFVAFAPKDDPKIAIAVFVENGYWGSRWAGPIASLMIEKYLTGETTNKYNENRMITGSLADEYNKQLLRQQEAIEE